MKRIFDIVLSVVGLLLLGWLIVLLALGVRVTSKGPGIFAQDRVGRRERPFVCYKLRTMFTETPIAATHEVAAHSVTPLGRWLRRLKLDELPQLWNVLKGDMSLVGPRPCLPTQRELIEARRRRGVYEVRPGITGAAQVLGIDMSDPDRLAEVDAAYVRRASLSRDLVLILRTIVGSGGGDHVRAK